MVVDGWAGENSKQLRKVEETKGRNVRRMKDEKERYTEEKDKNKEREKEGNNERNDERKINR